jgi:hypothetical protein
MFRRRLIAALGLAAGLVMGVPGMAQVNLAQVNKPIQCSDVESIGSAHMTDDGVITLYLRALPPAPISEGVLTYAPDDPQYDEIKQHLGGIKPGESKPVPPWC